MSYSSVITPTRPKISVSHQTNFGVANYDVLDQYSPDTGLWKAKVLDLVSPKYSPVPNRCWDASRYRNHGTITGATWTRLPSGLSALSFDGDDYVEADVQLFSVYPFSIGGWIWADSANTDNNTVFYEGIKISNSQYWKVCVRAITGVADMSARNITDYAIAGTTNCFDKWHLIMGVFASDTSRKLYVDGVQEGAEGTDSVGFYTDANSRYSIGRMGRATPYGYAKGKIALPLGVNAALSATQIANLYQQTKHLFGV